MQHARRDYQVIQPTQDGFVTIGKDEPVFLLRAKDALAAEAVRAWADSAEEAGVDEDLVEAARTQADEMEAYAATHFEGGQLPDAPEGVLP